MRRVLATTQELALNAILNLRVRFRTETREKRPFKTEEVTGGGFGMVEISAVRIFQSGKVTVGNGEKNNCFLEWVLDGAVKTMKAGGGFMLRLSLEYFFVSHLEEVFA